MVYWALPAGMVSAGVLLPVVKSVAETVAVQPAPKPRSSVTWTGPARRLEAAGSRGAEVRVGRDDDGQRPGDDGDGHGAARPPVPEGGQVLPGAAEVTVLVSMPLPVSGLLTLMSR